jgi:hypothetical protein
MGGRQHLQPLAELVGEPHCVPAGAPQRLRRDGLDGGQRVFDPLVQLGHLPKRYMMPS